MLFMEDEQKAALKLLYERDHQGEGEVPLTLIESHTGCNGLAMGDLLHKGYVVPVRGIEIWEITAIGKDFVENYLT